MAEPDLKRVKEVYTGALEQPSEQRQAYIEKACRGDPQLKDKVERMLAAMEGAADFMTSEGKIGVAETLDVSSTTQSHPESIGHYKILHTLGEGGMGIVYLAEQTEPVRRRVALKLVKLGMDTKQVIARFEAERQALAMMDHPNVAQVFEAGATDAGRPYFAMEYVPGVPITKFCDTFCLTVPERLELFMQVCGAIQHAHQKGIIHRDLKPTNVLVMRQNAKPVPKVIDFGVAKATQQRLTEQTLFTEEGQMIGTPAYMSPEQAEMSALGVDSRTDVYSLGVLLYELLVSMLPFEPAELRRAGYAEIQRIIREVDPPKPSTRFNSLGDESGSICDQRRLDTKSMRRLLQGDLDWITMKAIDKDPDRRYASASELAADVGRYLKDEPVVASPPGGAYRLRKFVRRNRTAVIAAAVVLVVLLGGIAGTSLGLIRARAAEFEQTRARQEAEIAREQAEQARDAAAKQRQIAEAAEREQNRARQEADNARDEAEKQKHQARRQSYLASIRGAQASIQANDVRNARELLDQAPSELRRWEWKYLHAQLDQSLAILHGHDDDVNSVAFSPDGTQIVSGSSDKTLRLWDAATGEALATLTGHEGPVATVAFSPDGSRIVSGSGSWPPGGDNTVRLWDVASHRQLAVLRGHETTMASVAFSPDGTRIASVSYEHTVRLWDSVASRDRVRERDQARRAEQIMSPFVDELFDQGLDCPAVADRVRTNETLSDALRHAAINLVLKRCSAIHEQAHSLIDDLEGRLIFAADIQAAVKENTSVEPAVHAAAVNIARLMEDTPGRLSRRAEGIVDEDGRSSADYERAQRAAASAFQSDSTSENFAHTLAKAWTRLQQPDEAIEVWREHVDQMRAATPTGPWTLTNALFEYGKALLENDRAKDAEPLLRESLSILEKRLNSEDPHATRWRALDHWQTKRTRGVLGECLTKQGADPSLALGARIEKLREAETILIELANAVLDDDSASKDDKTEAIQRVVDLYEAWHAAEPDDEGDHGRDARATKAAEWRVKLNSMSLTTKPK